MQCTIALREGEIATQLAQVDNVDALDQGTGNRAAQSDRIGGREALIDVAREIARADNTTLNEQFRLWLEAYTRKRRAERGMEVIERMGKYVSSGGKKLARDELNERG